MPHVFDESDNLALQKMPEYTYVPGITPHPVSHPAGHSHVPDRRDSARRLPTGQTLFCAGFYWEAHEAWEVLWLAAGRSGPRADLIKGLIKLAACGVKCLERNRAGAVRHAIRAEELFRGVATGSALADSTPLMSLIALARLIATDPPIATSAQQTLCRHGGVPLLGQLPEFELQSAVSREGPPHSDSID